MSAAEPMALYFGCLGGPGHFLHGTGGRTLYDGDVPGLPWDGPLMDTGLLKNRRVPDVPDGRVHWTGGGRQEFWFAFFWWDRSVDKRGACNSGFYVRGFSHDQPAEAFRFACEQWPEVVARQLHPLTLVNEADARRAP